MENFASIIFPNLGPETDPPCGPETLYPKIKIIITSSESTTKIRLLHGFRMMMNRGHQKIYVALKSDNMYFVVTEYFIHQALKSPFFQQFLQRPSEALMTAVSEAFRRVQYICFFVCVHLYIYLKGPILVNFKFVNFKIRSNKTKGNNNNNNNNKENKTTASNYNK